MADEARPIVAQLETHLADQYRGAVLLISHDRYFIDRVATAVLEVRPGGKTTLYALMADKKITSVRVGAKRLIHVDSLRRFLEAA